MNEVENVIKYYTLCNTLKNLVRTGWQKWNVQADRLESVAEHIYGVQMLAIAMYSEFKYDIDIYKVILMLSVHELEEIIIGDFTPFQISKEEKEKLGHEAIDKVLDCLLDKEQKCYINFSFWRKHKFFQINTKQQVMEQTYENRNRYR